jgi:hypothetical protein
MTVENPRLRLLLGTRWRVMVAALVVVTLVSFGTAAASYADQPTETVTQEVDQQTVTTTTTHRATVVAEDSLWPRGAVLSEKPVYLLNATPTLNVSAETGVDDADAARVTHTWRLRLRAAAGEETLYSETTELANVTRESTEATSSVAIDVPAVRKRMATIREKTEGVAAVTATVSLQVRYCTVPDGGCRYSGEDTYSTPLSVDGRSYTVDDEMGGATTHSTERQSEVPQPRDWGTIASMGLVGLFALALAGAVLSVDPRAIDVDSARQDLHRTQYEEWISPGVIPMSISQQFVELETIEDVVDVAIDTNERVVYDRRRDLYAVISENLVYYFSTGGSWMESAFRRTDVGGDGGPDPDGPFGGGPPAEEAFGFPEDGDQTPFGGGESEDSGGLEGGGDPFDGDGDDPLAGPDEEDGGRSPDGGPSTGGDDGE